MSQDLYEEAVQNIKAIDKCSRSEAERQLWMDFPKHAEVLAKAFPVPTGSMPHTPLFSQVAS